MNREPLNAANSTLQRLSPWAGIAFVALIAAAVALMADTPAPDDREGWLEFAGDSGDRWRQIIGAYVGVAAALAFLWFGHALVARLGGSRGGGDVLTSLARAAATLFAGLLMAAMLAAATVAGAVEIGEAEVPESADIGIMFDQFAYALLLIGSAMSAAVFIACVSELARQRGTWPRWVVWAGFVVAVLLIAAAFFFPIILIPLWTLLVSILLLTRAESPEPMR